MLLIYYHGESGFIFSNLEMICPVNKMVGRDISLGGIYTISDIYIVRHISAIWDIYLRDNVCVKIVIQINGFPKIKFKPPTFTEVGELIVFFYQDKIETSCRPFSYYIIAKCSYSCPSIWKSNRSHLLGPTKI